MDPEVGEVVWAWLGGAVPEPRRASLLLRLRTDAAFRLAFVEEVRMLGMLKVVRSGPPRWLRLEDLLGWSADAGHKSTTSLADAVTARIRTLPRPGRPDPAPPRRPWSLVALLFLGAIAAVIPFHRPGGPPREGVAVAVRVAGTEWAGGGVSEGGVVGPGPLVLRRGAVTLAFHNGVTAHVEGPADVDVVSAGGVFCHRGRIRVEVPRGATGFTVAAPGTCVGGAGVDYELAVDGGRAEVTVFGGRPVVTAAAGGDRPAATPGVGEFVRVDPRTGHLSAPAMKLAAMQAPPDTPVLLLAPDYAKAVLADRPAGYWRFESVTNCVIPNEVSGGTGLRLIGAPSLHGPAGGNRGLYFPPAGGPHGALSEGVWNPTGREFAVECWVLPRLAQQAAVLGVLAEGGRPQLDLHAVYLELTSQSAPGLNAARRVRGVYRVPVGRTSGTECLSGTTYRPLQWQHLIAQRRGDQFEIYLNGEVATSGPVDVTNALPRGRLLLGALYAARDGSSCAGRPFAGVVDEVAVYDHPLSASDVLRHYRMGPHRK